MKSIVILAVGLLLAGCATGSGKFAAIDSCLDRGSAWNYRNARCEPLPSGPVELIRVDKSERLMGVYRGGRLIREFRVALGRGGLAPKQRQGDGRVPEGRYVITDHNPNSAFHLSLRIGYPTAAQVAAAQRLGTDTGGDIMIHGLPNGSDKIGSRHLLTDWTEGCIAVTNREIEWLFKQVKGGTPIEISA